MNVDVQSWSVGWFCLSEVKHDNSAGFTSVKKILTNEYKNKDTTKIEFIIVCYQHQITYMLSDKKQNKNKTFS